MLELRLQHRLRITAFRTGAVRAAGAALTAVVVAAALVLAVGAVQTRAQSGGGGIPPVPASGAKLLGQRIMVGFSGTAPSRALLRRVRAGEVGAVILFADNIAS